MKKIIQSRRILIMCMICLLASVQVSCQDRSFVSTSLSLECVKQIVGDNKIIGSQVLDVNQDGNSDEIVAYEKNDKIYVLIALASASHCEVFLNEETTYYTGSTTGGQTVEVRAIELIELTGDNKPEVHVWLDVDRGSPRLSQAVHTIYTSGIGNWRRIGVFALCLAYNVFEFRDRPGKVAKDIYVAEDLLCQPPYPGTMIYQTERWDGAKFVSIRSGEFEGLLLALSRGNPCCICPLLFVLISGIAYAVRRRRNQGFSFGKRHT